MTASDYMFSAVFIALIFRQVGGRPLTAKSLLVPMAIAKAGPLAVVLWVLGTGSRLAFGLYALHGGGPEMAASAGRTEFSAPTGLLDGGCGDWLSGCWLGGSRSFDREMGGVDFRTAVGPYAA
ncbi:MAG: hypothetical protein ACYDH5_03955 [Acidimicrobiales bacterium]